MKGRDDGKGKWWVRIGRERKKGGERKGTAGMKGKMRESEGEKVGIKREGRRDR